jgi:hypothetical protein
MFSSHLVFDAVQSVAILMPDEQGRHAETKRGWQEPGVIPPRGFHHSKWRG